MGENVLVGLAAIVVFGIFAQWFSWVLRLPSILMLLIIGFVAGPITGLLNPDDFFGDLLFPFVSISVAIILFEGGLSLKVSELKPVLKVVRRLITIGTVVTWLLSTIAAHYFIGLSISLSLLLGAILVVTGPTVIIPLLRLVKPKGKINSILKWEGIVNDPIGAMLALLVFDVIISAGVAEATFTVLFIILKTLFISIVIGIVGAYLLVYMFKKDYIPDYLQNPASLATIVLVFVFSNLVQIESGLFAVTTMGIILANQKQVVVEHIIEFKENIGVLLLSSLFIILAARLQVSDLALLDFGTVLFIVALILVIRPATIFLSSIGSDLNWKEKIYLSWMAPRGIVAAAVTSIFAIELLEHGYEEAKVLVPLMFIVIIASIVIYGLSAIPLAKILNLSDSNPQGVLIAGINKLSLEIHKVLVKHKFKVLIVDNNWEKVTSARQAGYNASFGSVVAEKTHETLELSGIGKFISLTPNRGINSLAAIYFAKVFGKSNVFQLYTASKRDQDIPKELRGTLFSSQNLSYSIIQNYMSTLLVKSTKLSEEFSYDDLRNQYEKEMVHPLFLITEDKKIEVFSENNIPKVTEGVTIVSLILKETKQGQ